MTTFLMDPVLKDEVVFSAVVDEDGDFTVRANGDIILWISQADGCLHIMNGIDNIPGLDIDNNGRLVVLR